MKQGNNKKRHTGKKESSSSSSSSRAKATHTAGDEGGHEATRAGGQVQQGNEASKYTTNFESSQWPPLLLAIACIIGSSTENSIIPTHHETCGVFRSNIVMALFMCLDMYFELTKKEYTLRNLDELERRTIPHTLESVYAIYRMRQALKGYKKHFAGYKLHILNHIPHLIKRFGAPANWDTATYETSHKSFVKERWETGCKRLADLELRTMLQVCSTTIYLCSPLCVIYELFSMNSTTHWYKPVVSTAMDA